MKSCLPILLNDAMVYKCCVPRCPTGTTHNRTKKKVSMQKFPTDPGLQEKLWRVFLGKTGLQLNTALFLFFLHFHEENFAKSTMDSYTRIKSKRKEYLVKRYLMKDAIPTLFRQLPLYLSKAPIPARSNTATTSSKIREFETTTC